MRQDRTRPTHFRRGRKWLACALTAVVAGPTARAQDAAFPPVSEAIPSVPGDGTLAPDRLVPFVAEYTQMGFPFRFRFERTVGLDRAQLSAQMVMRSPDGIGVDHVGLHADDLSFAYRRFAYGAFRNEYVEVVGGRDSLRVRRMPRSAEAEGETPSYDAIDGGGPVLDGTILYWLLGTLSLEEGGSWSFPTWHLTPESLEVRRTPPFTAERREDVVLADGTAFDAWVVEAISRGTTWRMWVADRPPYLLRQVLVSPEGEAMPVLEAVSVSTRGVGLGPGAPQPGADGR